MKSKTSIPLLGALLLAPLCAGGCRGAGQYEVVPVTGVLRCQGKPVPNAVVTFTPQQDPDRPKGQPGRTAHGITDDNGRFTLTTYQDDDGAIVGKHMITVSVAVNDQGNPTVNATQFPCPRDATKEVTVEPGMEEVLLEF